MRRLLYPLLSMCIVAGACAPEPGGYEVADRVIAQVNQPSQRVDVFDSGCERTVTIDEYGFETESISCPEDAAPVTAPPASGFVEGDPINADALLAAEDLLPGFVLEPLMETAPEPVRQAFLATLPLTVELEASCGIDLDRWTDALAKLSAQSSAINQSIDSGELGEFVGSSSARALGRSYFERNLLQPDCAAPGARPTPATDPQFNDLVTLTAEASAAVAETDRLLSGSVMTRLFHFFSTVPSYAWLRNPVESPDLVVLGSSQAGDGVDVPLLADQTGLAVGNAFLPGSLAEVQQHWIHEVFRYTSPTLVVWPIGPVDTIGDCIQPGRAEQFVARLENRQQLFATAGWFSATDPVTVALGPVPAQPNTNMGNAPKGAKRDEASIEAQIPNYSGQFSDTSFCSDRIAIALQVIDTLTSWGAHVVVVGMPVSPDAVALVPGGAETIAASMTQLQSPIQAETTADFVDLSAGFEDPSLWRDLTHLTGGGARRFSSAIATELARLGLTQ